MVVDDVSTAFGLVGEGRSVVLILAAGRQIGPLPEVPGRLAVIIGDPGEAATHAAAEAMDAELFVGGHV